MLISGDLMLSASGGSIGARSVSHLLRAFETFKALGIDFVSFSEQMDTSTPAGKMVFTVLGAVAELERSLIVERVRAGMRNARAKGASVGLRALNYRYKREPPSLAAIYGKEPVFGPRQEIWYLLGHRSEMCWGIPRTTGEGPLSA
jgi:Resolvase, N terminal domain